MPKPLTYNGVADALLRLSITSQPRSPADLARGIHGLSATAIERFLKHEGTLPQKHQEELVKALWVPGSVCACCGKRYGE